MAFNQKRVDLHMLLSSQWLQKIRVRIKQHEPVIHVLLLGLLYMMLDHQYRHFVSPLFLHLNFTCEPVMWRLVTAWLCFAFTLSSFFWLKPSGYLHATSVLFIILFLIPNLILFQYMPTHPAIPALMVMFTLLLRIPVKLTWVTNKIPIIGPKSTQVVLPLIGILCFIPVIRHFGFSLPGMNLFTDTALMYEVREELQGNVPVSVAYSLGQLTKAILPSLLLYGLVTKRYWMSGLAALGIAYIFMVNPHKTFLMALAPLLFFAFWDHYHRKTTWFITLLLAGIVVSMIMAHQGNILPGSMLVRRSLFTQAFLTHAYFEFFHGAPLHLSHSFLSGLGEYPHHLPPPYLIGEQYFCSPIMSCNTGFIGDGFMNFGFVGALLFLTLTAIIFHFINALNLTPIWFGLTFMILFQLQNTYLFTTLISHGLLMQLLLMAVVLRKREGM